jgi:hypothetical protein
MATAKWKAAEAESSNIAGTALNSLATATASGILADISNGTGKDLNIRFWIVLGSAAFTGGTIQVRLVPKRSSTYVSRDESTFTGESASIAIPTGTSAKELCSGGMRLDGGFTFGVELVNNSGVTLASSGNEVYYQVWDEEVA